MEDISINDFTIAELNVRIIYKDTRINNMQLLLSFEPFRTQSVSDGLFFQLTIDDSMKPVSKEHRYRIRAFDTGNGDTIVDKLDNG